jgi:hypothetical protein
MAAENDGIGSPSGEHDPAAEAAGTPLRGDLVCKTSFRVRAPDKVQTDPRRTSDEPSTDRRRARCTGKACDAGVNDVLAAARRPAGRWGGAGCSPLYEWLWARFDALSAELSPPRRPNWRSVADALAARAAAGDTAVLDGWGEVPGSETVRQTWWRVRKDKAAAAISPVVPTKPVVPPTRAPHPVAVRPTEKPAQHEDGATTPTPTRRFSMGARPRPWSPPPDASEE